MSGLKQNYYALMLCILSELTIEKSLRTFNCLEHSRKITGKHNPDITDNDIEEMMRMKKLMTYGEIGEMYGISDKAVYGRIRRYQQKKAVG